MRLAPAIGLATLALAALPGSALGAAGDLDPSFGSGTGVVTTAIGPGKTFDSGQGVAIQPDGKIVVGGSGNHGFAVARYNPDGSLDTSFDGDSGNGNGIVTVPVGAGEADAFGMALQSDGKIVVVGSADGGISGEDMAVIRLDGAGKIDPSFGTGGTKLIDVTSHSADDGSAVAVQPDGKIVLAGDDGNDFAVVRLLASGAPDTSFGGGDGKVTADLEGDQDFGNDMTLDGGRIVVIGAAETASGADTAIAVFDSSGALDHSFSGDGKDTQNLDPVVSDFGEGVTVQPDGRILIAGSAKDDFTLLRYLPGGTPDPTFGGGSGMVLTPMAPGTNGADGTGVAVQPDGKLVEVGSVSVAATDSDFGLARFNADGSLDPTFAGGGKVIDHFTDSFDSAVRPVLQPDGRLVVAGRATSASTGADFAVARYLADPPPLVGPPTPAGPPKDVTAPVLKLTIPRGQRLRTVLRRGLRTRVACNEPCSLSERLTLARRSAKRLKIVRSKAPVTIGRRSRRLAAGSRVTLTLKLTKKARRELKRFRPKSLTVTLQVVAVDGSGNRRAVNRKLKIRR